MMKARSFLILFLWMAYQSTGAQPKDDPDKYKMGYALKGKDTIWCKIIYNSKYDGARTSVTLLINDDEVTFFTGGPITGFGIEENGNRYDYGIVNVDMSVANRRLSNLVFVKKLAAGTIDLFEYTYSIRTTKTKTINGEEQPGTTTSSQNYTNHYIAKTDSAFPLLATPVPLASFRKKDMEVYIGDNADLLARSEKKFSLKELLAIIKEYNNWSLEKKSQAK